MSQPLSALMNKSAYDHLVETKIMQEIVSTVTINLVFTEPADVVGFFKKLIINDEFGGLHIYINGVDKKRIVGLIDNNEGYVSIKVWLFDKPEEVFTFNLETEYSAFMKQLREMGNGRDDHPSIQFFTLQTTDSIGSFNWDEVLSNCYYPHFYYR